MKISEIPDIQGPSKLIANLVAEYGDVTIDCPAQGFALYGGDGDMQFLLVPKSISLANVDPNTQQTGNVKTELASYYAGERGNGETVYLYILRRNASALAICTRAVADATKQLEAAGLKTAQPARAAA